MENITRFSFFSLKTHLDNLVDPPPKDLESSGQLQGQSYTVFFFEIGRLQSAVRLVRIIPKGAIDPGQEH